MEYCGRDTLSNVVTSRTRGRVSSNEAIRLFKCILLALEHIHELGFCHRDIKLSNVMLSSTGRVKLIDLGFAAPDNSPQDIFCGTPYYMPPEISLRREYFGKEADIWSAGVLAFKLLTGDYPFNSKISYSKF